MYVWRYVCTYVCKHVWLCACTLMCMSMYVFVCVCVISGGKGEGGLGKREGECQRHTESVNKNITKITGTLFLCVQLFTFIFCAAFSCVQITGDASLVMNITVNNVHRREYFTFMLNSTAGQTAQAPIPHPLTSPLPLRHIPQRLPPLSLSTEPFHFL